MVPDILRIIFHVIDNICRNIATFCIDVVVIIASGLTLENIAVVQQNDIIAKLSAQRLYITAHSGQRTFLGLSVDEIVREKTTMDVTCFNNS